MAGTAGSRLRHRATIALATAAITMLGMALSACAKDDQTASGNQDGRFGEASTPSAGTGVTASPTASQTGGPAPTKTANVTPIYPSDAKSYALEFLKAWNLKDYARLEHLGVAAAVQQVKDSITFGGLPNGNWHYIRCDGAAGSQYCTFRNDNGDETIIRLQSAQLGHPTAVTEAPLQRTEFAKNAAQYVSNFIGAWGSGNRQRMLAYSTQSVVDYVTHYVPITSYTTGCSGAGSTTLVTVSGLGDNLGASYTFEVNNSLVASGQKHAITKQVASGSAGPC